MKVLSASPLFPQYLRVLLFALVQVYSESFVLVPNRDGNFLVVNDILKISIKWLFAFVSLAKANSLENNTFIVVFIMTIK